MFIDITKIVVLVSKCIYITRHRRSPGGFGIRIHHATDEQNHNERYVGCEEIDELVNRSSHQTAVRQVRQKYVEEHYEGKNEYSQNENT